MIRPISKTRTVALALAAGIAGALLITGPGAQATVTITQENNPQPGEQNILFGTDQTGTLFTGTTNQTHTIVQFISTANLETGGVGQAKLQGEGNTDVIGSITFFIPSGTFTDFIFDAAVTGPTANGGSTIVSAISNDGPFSLNANLTQGSNFFTLIATGGEVINSVTLALAPGTTIGQFAQPRVSGVSVPEPASLALLGSALLGLGVLLRRKRA